MGSTWSLLGASWAQLGASWAPLGPNLDLLGASWSQLGASWAPLGLNFGALGALLGVSWAYLGSKWSPNGLHVASKWPPSGFQAPLELHLALQTCLQACPACFACPTLPVELPKQLPVNTKLHLNFQNSCQLPLDCLIAELHCRFNRREQTSIHIHILHTANYAWLTNVSQDCPQACACRVGFVVRNGLGCRLHHYG